MTAILLGWNPDRGNIWNYDAVIEQIAEAGQVRARWSVGRRRNIEPGAEAWLVLQGRSPHVRGLIGHGVVSSESFEVRQDPERDQASTRYVTVAFDALLQLGSQISPDRLYEAAPGIPWDSFPSSCRSLPSAAEAGIRRLWQDAVPTDALDPMRLPPGTYPEAAVTRVEVNRYEKSPEARRLCLAYHGTVCAACGFSFETHYGDAGKDYIQVHHIVPVPELNAGYRLDPIADLVPLCANCHCMAHLDVKAPRSLQELRALIASAGHISGQLLDSRALEAQRAARRILEQH